eukprot:COSAG06_NODE_44445_length_363_cov_0.973485_1_plen_54_part_10
MDRVTDAKMHRDIARCRKEDDITMTNYGRFMLHLMHPMFFKKHFPYLLNTHTT